MPPHPELKRTVHLPRTSFEMKADLPNREPKTLDYWAKIGVYDRIREARAGLPPYVLHDGPPYANNSIHLGQALNKILKDFVVKSRSMAGHDAPYVPGWDCHGLPIEHRVETLHRDDIAALKTLDSAQATIEIRRRCREHAERFIEVQRQEFRRLGVLWDHALDAREEAAGAPDRRAIYRTIDRSYEAEIVRRLGEFFVRGSVYHGVKPVHWCWSCRTALAEAEVEYRDRDDPSIWVRFPLRGAESRIPALGGRDVSVTIWTTTPWTLPANLAVALHPQLPYVALDVAGEARIVAEGLAQAVAERLGWGEPRVLARFTGEELGGSRDGGIAETPRLERPYPGPATAGGGATSVLVLGEHVTLDAGTGAVHTAPGHGEEDFLVGQRYGLPAYTPVGDDGRFLPAVGVDWLAGRFVLEANARIVDDLRARGLLLAAESYRHSYPHCWRCKSPVLFRATPQWFIAMEHERLRERALDAIHATHWVPATGEARIGQMIGARPDWCISRQRTWGVPIPAVVCARCLPEDPQAFVRDAALFEHVAALFAAEGSDAWFGAADGTGGHRPYRDARERLERLVPSGLVCPHCKSRDHLALHEHIVDVWFESGCSHSAVLGRDPRLPWPADAYLEGHDQYRGWFHSSLLVAVGERGRAPYREVVTHGFTLDAAGRKMSKSEGNVVSPQDLAGQRGAEIVRLWVAMIDFLEDMRLSDETLDRNAEAYRKIRNTFRYALGNLDGFDPLRDPLPYAQLEELDRFALQQLERLRQRLLEAYAAHQYHVVYHGLHQFCAVTLSAFYFDVLKDRLYTLPRRHPARRSAQTVLYRLAHDLCRLMAPVLCFTAEEIWQHLEPFAKRKPWDGATVHAELFPGAAVDADDPPLVARWERLLRLRDEVYKALEAARAEKRIGTGLEARVVLEARPDDEAFLRSFGDELRFLLLTSEVAFGSAGAAALRSTDVPGLAVAVERMDGAKCERCWHWTRDVGTDRDWPTVCARCARHVREVLADPEPA